MSGFSLWQGGKKTKDFQFQDGIAREFIFRGGTSFMIHKYIGPYEQSATDSTLFSPKNKDDINELTIQDVLLGENRDRKYSDDIFELRGCYTVNDTDFDLSQFGYLLSGDTIVVEFHTNESIERLGRKLMSGDVIEVVHLRDDTSLAAGEIKKYYVVQDSTRSAIGFGPTWFSHIWRVRCTPIQDTQEYRDILHNQEQETSIDWLSGFDPVGDSDAGKSLDQNLQSTYDVEMENQKVRAEYQKDEVQRRSFYAKHLFIKADDEQTKTGLIRWILNGDGTPDNWDRDVIHSGDRFPEDPSEGDYFVRTDYVPERLFKRVGPVWRKVSEVWRREWVPAHRLLESFLNNNNITSVGVHEDETFDEKQALSKVVLPKTKK